MPSRAAILGRYALIVYDSVEKNPKAKRRLWIAEKRPPSFDEPESVALEISPKSAWRNLIAQHRSKAALTHHGEWNMTQDLPGFREVHDDYEVEALITAFSRNDQEFAELSSADILLLPERFQFTTELPPEEYYPDSTASFLQFLETETEMSTGILARASDDETFMRKSAETWLPVISIASSVLTPIVVDIVRRYLLKEGNQQDDIVHFEMVADDRKFKYDGHVKNLHAVVEEMKDLWDE